MRIPFIGEIITRAESLEVIHERELQKLRTENAYLKSRIRAFTDYAYRTKRGECYMIIQKADGKFERVQLPEV